MMSTKTANLRNAVIAVLFMAASGTGMHLGREYGWFTLVKKPLPILRPLSDLDAGRLAPWRVVRANVLSADMIQEMGTAEYLDCEVENPQSGFGAGKSVQILVTYYTGVTDQVPHVPEECYVQGAFSLEKNESMNLELKGLGRTIEARRLLFAPPGSMLERGVNAKKTVYYFFCVNGEYMASRNEVRSKMLNPREKHLYYSKVELAIVDRGGMTPAAMDQAASELLDALTSELAARHWPPAEWAVSGPPK